MVGDGGGTGAGLPGRRNTKDTIYQGVACLRSWKILMMAIGERGEATETVRAWESLCKASTCSARVCIFRTQEPHPKPPEEEGFIPLGDHLRGLNNNTDAQVPLRAFQVVLVVKNPPAKAGRLRRRRFRSLGWEDPLEEGMATHSSILAWRIPWIEQPCRLQSVG